MSVDAHLIHRCTVERGTLRTDIYRTEQRVYAPHLTDVACRLVIRSQRQFGDVNAQFVVVTVYKLLVRPGVDIQEGDRIAGLVYEDGTLVRETFTVRAILPRRARTVRHVTLELERVS